MALPGDGNAGLRPPDERDGIAGACRPADPAAVAHLRVDRGHVPRIEGGSAERASLHACAAAGACRLIDGRPELAFPHGLVVVDECGGHRHAAALKIAVADGGDERSLERPYRMHEPLSLGPAEDGERLLTRKALKRRGVRAVLEPTERF